MEKAELNKLILMVVIFCICCIQKVTGVSEAYLTNYTKCAFSLANIDFNISLDAADSIVGKRTWLLHGNKIAESNGITLTPVASYSSRLTAYGTYGISLSNVNVADTGTYTYVVVLSPSGNPITATATLSVQEPPNAGCSVDASQSGIIVTCSVSGSCGTPVLEPDWENETGISNMFHCDKQKTYRCCATSAALKNCYTGSPDNFCKVYSCSRTTTTTSVTPPSSSSWSTSSSTSKPSSAPSTAITNNTSANLTTGTTANATNSASTLTSSIKTESTTSVTNNKSSNTTVAGSTSTSPTTTGSSKISSKSVKDGVAINVIVPAVVVPGGLLLIGVIILLVVCKRRSRARKNVHETLDGMAVQNRESNVNGRKVSSNNGRAADKFDTVYTTPDGFIIYPGPAAMSSARPHKDKNYHDVTDQYNRPYAGTYGYQISYDPNTYTSSRAYTHKDKKHHDVPHQYSRPYTGTYGYQAVHVPGTYMSDRDYNHKGKNYDNDEPNHHRAPHQMGSRRPAYMQTAYYPQTGYSGQISQDVYYRGGGQYSYGQRSKSHDNSGRQQQREYNNQYEMADYGGIRAGYLHTAQYGKNTDLYY